MFDNTDPITNGEIAFFHSIEEECKLIFDVGCRQHSIYLDFAGAVHYFDPIPEHIQALAATPGIQNYKSVFNPFGLGDTSGTRRFYPDSESFVNRNRNTEPGGPRYHVKTGAEYMAEQNIDAVDLLKIDTEGYELKVLQGFGNMLSRVDYIQFEYGGTYKDAEIKLIDVVRYLQSHGFTQFAYLNGRGPPTPLLNLADHYRYCNIICRRVKV